MPDIKLFAGNATPELAKKISERLYISLGDATVGRFSDGEIQVQINENVRGADVFIIQSTSPLFLKLYSPPFVIL